MCRDVERLFLTVPQGCLRLVIVVFPDHTHLLFLKMPSKVSRVQRSEVPHPTKDTNGKVTNSQLDTTNESQEVSPFPAGDHKAHINRRTQRHSKHKTEQKHKRSTKEVPPWNGQLKYFTGGLKPVSRRANLTLNSDVDQDT